MSATKLLENGSNFLVDQKLHGHNYSKTTEIYTNRFNINSEVVTSPMDKMKIVVN